MNKTRKDYLWIWSNITFSA